MKRILIALLTLILAAAFVLSCNTTEENAEDVTVAEDTLADLIEGDVPLTDGTVETVAALDTVPTEDTLLEEMPTPVDVIQDEHTPMDAVGDAPPMYDNLEETHTPVDVLPEVASN